MLVCMADLRAQELGMKSILDVCLSRLVGGS